MEAVAEETHASAIPVLPLAKTPFSSGSEVPKELNDGNIADESQSKYSFSVENFEKNRRANGNQDDNLPAVHRKQLE